MSRSFATALFDFSHLLDQTDVTILSLAPVVTQHALTTQFIAVYDNNTAAAITYFTATLFGQGKATGATLFSYGKYLDTLIPVNGTWLVSERTTLIMVSDGPFHSRPEIQ